MKKLPPPVNGAIGKLFAILLVIFVVPIAAVLAMLVSAASGDRRYTPQVIWRDYKQMWRSLAYKWQ